MPSQGAGQSPRLWFGRDYFNFPRRKKALLEISQPAWTLPCIPLPVLASDDRIAGSDEAAILRRDLKANLRGRGEDQNAVFAISC
jgi:hypothetical protein